jgi:hypothetical protein
MRRLLPDRFGSHPLLVTRLGAFAAALAPLLAAASTDEPRAPLDIRVRDGLVTVRAADVPLGEVLSTLGKAAGVKLFLRGSFESPLRTSFEDAPLNEAIRRLTESHSVAVVHHVDENGDEGGVVSVWVFEKESSEVRPAPAGARGDVPTAPRRREEREALDYPASVSAVEVLDRLHRLDGETALHLLGRIVREDPDPYFREQAISALAETGDDGAVSLMAAALADEDAGVRRHAVDSLARVGGTPAVQFAGQALHGDPDARVRLAAVEVLAGIEGEAARAMLAVGTKDADRQVSRAAHNALGIPAR